MGKDDKYICCRRCLDEKPLWPSMKEYERPNVSLSGDATKVQIWCARHDTEVATFGNGRWLQRVTDGVVAGTEDECWPQTVEGP